MGNKMKITAWKCEDTGEIFEHEKDYRACRRGVILNKREMQERIDTKQRFGNWLAKEKESIFEINQIAPWILKNQKELMSWVNELNHFTFSSDRFYPETDEILEANITEVRFERSLSNSHSCPKDGVMNWCNHDKNLPSGYAGYQIRISGITKRTRQHMGSYPTSNLFGLIGVNTECGGGINEGWTWQGKIFVADWPGIGQEILSDVLKGVK